MHDSPENKPQRLTELTFQQVAGQLNQCKALILPLGGLEPFSQSGVLGSASFVCENIAGALSANSAVLMAPVLEYGCSTPYKAFQGSAGLKSRTLSNLLLELCSNWFFQGFKKIFLLNFSTHNSEALEIFLSRVNPGQMVYVFSFHTDERVKSFRMELMPGDEYGRSEFALMSILAYLSPELIGENKGGEQKLPPLQVYKTWQKRGMDPQRFRKLFPTGSVSQIASRYSADLGKELFRYILSLLEKDLSHFLSDIAE